MIVAQRKTIPELKNIINGHENVLVLGCGTCVTVCLAGGEREVAIISSALRIAFKKTGERVKVSELTIERQCDNVFIETAVEEIKKMMQSFRWVAGLVFRLLRSVSLKNRFMPDLTLPF